MTDLIVFAMIGLLAGAAARILYPGRQPGQILLTMLLGMGGAVAGGMISWTMWPAVEGQFQSGNLFWSLLGAMILLTFWAAIAYARSVSGSRTTSH